ncbi:MAG: c-type cytochrome domain-containing protein, partial [Chthoniobacteraceae bacterium]
MITRQFERLASCAARALAIAIILPTGGLIAEEAPVTGAAMRILKKNCLSCHNEQKTKGELSLATQEALLRGGSSGEVVVPGTPEKSLLIESLDSGADPHMPPKKQLPPEQIQLLTRWVQEGAPWDAAALAGPSSDPREVPLAALPGSYHPVFALAISPDGARLAVGCGNQLVVYDIVGDSPSLIARASAHPDPVQSIAWSPDGKQLATGAFRRVVVWKAEALAAEQVVTTGLTDRISALQFLPDGSQLVIADGRIAEEGMLRIANTATGAIAKSWVAHTDTIFDVAVSADGKWLATAGGDRMV